MRPSRRRGRLGGLRGQLVGGLAALLFLALGLVGFATLQLHERQLYQASADEARRYISWLATIPPADRAPALTALSDHPDIFYVGPLDSGPPLPSTDSLFLAPMEDAPALWAHDEELLLVLSTARPRLAIFTSQRALALYLLITLFFVTVVGFAFFSFVILRPLRALRVATERASQGDLASPVTVIPRNELGQLARQFNEMLQRLETQRNTLQEQLQELQLANEELRRTRDTLIRSEKLASVGHLAAGVAHEIGNPLSAIMGYTDLLADRDLDAETSADLQHRILTQLQRIRDIIRQLLDYSRSDPTLEPQAVPLKRIVEDTIHLVRAIPGGSHTQFAVSIPEDLLIQALPGEFSQALLNLFLNAINAMGAAQQDQPRVEITAEVLSESQCVLRIRDNGPGIPEELAERVFDPFFTTRPPGEGTGLGLAITHRIIERIGGEIALNAPDSGASFQITLPRAS